jgi:uncharacterized protein YggE
MGQEPHGHEDARTVTVTGTGWAEAPPDLMLVSVGVECRGESVEEAYAAAGQGLARVGSVLRSHGVAPADIRSAGLTVRADLAWRDGEGQKLVGYVAAGSLMVRLRNIGSASANILSRSRRRGCCPPEQPATGPFRRLRPPGTGPGGRMA